MSARRSIVVLVVCAVLSGCDALTGALGIESPEKVAAGREAEGKAIGGACRHAGHAIEDCYSANKKADKAAIFAGWREMNDYMRENKIDEVPSRVVPPQLAAARPGGEEDAADVKGGGHGEPAPKARDRRAPAS